MNKYIILIAALVLSGCSDSDTDKISTHEAYSKLVESGVFPERMESDLTEILDNSSRFRLEQYFEFDDVIYKHCGVEGHSLAAKIVVKAMALVFPMDLRVFSDPLIAIKRQVDTANSCEFKPFIEYIGLNTEFRNE